MFLQKISLNGFKSFAARVEIEFDPGITAVVGPNGCGKSNISDAVRWVLGEQNPRKLRGSRMGDLIFNGTVTRSPLGLAQATLVFDNSDGFLPVPYSEVSVTRKLFRDGESEYLLNATPCRLKDITDLFMDSGIGTNAYSMMEQGRVDMIVNARPQERREIIEEAAGVSRYLRRQAEALRKLERTENDLVVVNNVISELERQKRSLERQAKQAERAQRYRRELKSAEAVSERRRGRKLQKDTSEVEAQLNTLRERVSKCHDELLAIRTRKSELVRAAQDVEGHTRGCRDEYLQLNNTLEQTGKQIESLRGRIAEHRQLAERFRTEAQNDRERSEQEQNRVELADRQIDEISTELARFEEEVTWAERDAEAVDAGWKRTVAEGELKRKGLTEVQRSLAEHRERSREWERDLRFYQSRLEKLSAQREQTVSDIETHRLRSEELKTTAAEIEQAVSDLTARLEQLDADLHKMQEERDTCAKERHETEAAWQQKNSRLESLIRLQNSLEGFAAGVRFLLRGREGPSEGLLYTVAEKISVEKGFERAIETALAEALEGIVAEDVETIRHAIDRLHSGKKGRVAFLPKDRQRESREEVPEPLRHLRHAPSLVQSDETLHGLVCRLLGRSIVVDTLEEGLQYRDQLPPGWRIVTVSGESLDDRGVIVGGTTGEKSLLSRTNEIDQLERETQELSAHREELENRYTEIRETLAATRQNRDDVRERKMAAEGKLRHAREDLQRTDEQISRAETELTAIEEERAQIDDAVQQGTISEEYRKRVVAELNEKETLCTTEIAEWEGRMEVSEEHRTKVRQEVSDLNMRIFELQKDRERWTEQRDTLKRHLQEMARSIREKEELVGQQQEREQEVRKEIETLERNLGSLKSQRDELWQKIQEGDSQGAAIRAQIDEVEKEEQATTEIVQGIDEQRGEYEQQRVRLSVEIEYWDRRMREMFDGEIPEDLTDEDERSDEEIEELVATLRRRLDRLGTVNELAIEEYEEVRQRHEFLIDQRDDLEKAKSSLLQTTRELHNTAVKKFTDTLEQVRENFNTMFRKIFGGGRAEIRLLEGDPIEAGIEIEVQPPGKKLQSISLLSGGEKSLVGVALMFAIYNIKPSPFCVLDEIDAALDDANVSRFTSMLEMFTNRSQFIIITHNKHTMEIADTIYGVTMEEEGVSSIISMRLNGKEEQPREIEETTRETGQDELTPEREQHKSILEPDVFDTRLPDEPVVAEETTDSETGEETIARESS